MHQERGISGIHRQELSKTTVSRRSDKLEMADGCDGVQVLHWAGSPQDIFERYIGSV
ncbi:hypothetical protein SATMO3_59460 [Sporomusa aerivorans]